MEKHLDFNIPFKGLGAGNHRYTFEIDDAFFERFEYSEAEKGRVKVDLDLLREPALMDLHFSIDGQLWLACDRCLKMYDHPVKGDFRLIIKLGDEFAEESDEVLVIPHTESQLDVSQYIFEFISLLIPIRHAHGNPADCDQEVIEKLEGYSKPQSDPRWEALKNIKLK